MGRFLIVALVVIVALAGLYVRGGGKIDACDVAENWSQPGVCTPPRELNP